MRLDKTFWNPFNWLAGFRLCWIFANPAQVIVALARRQAPASVRVRTPIGSIALVLRDFESLKTVFSVFCREDYFVTHSDTCLFLDIGANIGIASAFFLSRNRTNAVRAFEPDLSNLPYLRRNLIAFGDRATISDHAVHVDTHTTVLYRSAEGKHSSLHQTGRAKIPQPTVACLFSGILADTAAIDRPTIVKLDVEGTEGDLVQSVAFENYPQVRLLMVESAECGRWVTRPHRRKLRNGLVEHLSFTA
jgi:FkbM family methyltransferase